MRHKVYRSIVKAVREGRLDEPFDAKAFRRECPGFARATYNTFLNKHREGNPGGASELFERVSPGKFKCLRPFRYGL